ncbi:hypothetical protein HCUR_01080 [Holospora curviuscula]|uniref:Uncharacterized protein n=1 Tax=Holospora curviuscula TaxID=1082868 RepID=A0A2S5R853_9PROT|nr:hypothetical protein HCUR_01080 [Holospora curviuscula]
MLKQPFFACEATAVSAKVTIAIDDAMTGYDNRQLISSIGICNGTVSCGPANSFALRNITSCLTIWNTH